jgi:hypothetical protein
MKVSNLEFLTFFVITAPKPKTMLGGFSNNHNLQRRKGNP